MMDLLELGKKDMSISNQFIDQCKNFILKEDSVHITSTDIDLMFTTLEDSNIGSFVYPTSFSCYGISRKNALYFLQIVSNNSNFLTNYTIPEYQGFLYKSNAIAIITSDHTMFSGDNVVKDRDTYEEVDSDELRLIIAYKVNE